MEFKSYFEELFYKKYIKEFRQEMELFMCYIKMLGYFNSVCFCEEFADAFSEFIDMYVELLICRN